MFPAIARSRNGKMDAVHFDAPGLVAYIIYIAPLRRRCEVSG